MATDNIEEVDKLIVDGIQFTSETDAQKAVLDASKVKLLKSRININKVGDVKAVYEKAIENKIFKTPVGWMFLMDLRNRLLSAGMSEDDVLPLPMEVSFTRHSALENLNVKQRIKPEKNNAQFKIIFPIVLNVFLILLVVLMFVINLNSESDNILNYKSNVTNRYASWEQDLKEREKKVREAEKRLGIQDTSSYYDDTSDN
ncbi:hypothetical protein [Butyrivibrio sp. YAB3001]|uniref:hypothetical protein n=1 Tax=Butyrivibrio sp. YAB3001 TaxID=1520812 RepID=UPI0008F66592|nr:hypothetical protein [Butyrivibrio sp. YAB3001]SFB69000.1 hypothetical protein SAMN02910398_00251 [Butyrivibrio sp. YAB3001]